MHQLSKELGIESKLIWTGEYDWGSDEASIYLRAADVCVLPFDIGVYLNNSSFTAAAAHGLPIITTHGATLEQPFVHRENVFLCPPKSSRAIAAAIKTLMDEPDLRQHLRLGALKLAQEYFSWETAVERTITTLATVL
jgi:glycosyltransferase involved in cell wall biosynthesis